MLGSNHHDQINVAAAIAFNFLPYLDFFLVSFSSKVTEQKQSAPGSRDASISVPCKAGGWPRAFSDGPQA